MRTRTSFAQLAIAGALQARQPLTALGADDPDTTLVTLSWVLGEDVVLVEQRIPRTPRIGSAALGELLWGLWSRSPATAGVRLERSGGSALGRMWRRPGAGHTGGHPRGREDGSGHRAHRPV